MLNGICNGVDRQIPNVVSLICLAEEDVTEVTAMARNANCVGLFGFCSKTIANHNDKQIGSVELFCGLSRGPSAREFQLNVRAACLAALAIESHRNGTSGMDFRELRERAVRWRALE